VPGASRRTTIALAWVLAYASPGAAQIRTEDVRIIRPPLATVVLDRAGGLLGEIGPQARTWVRIVELPAFVGQAFVATEDRRFYLHDGVDVVGVMGAIRDNIMRGFGSRGASTITQQLVGTMFPEEVDRREITISRKMREAELARALERRHTKAEILEAYLNYINFGHGWYGIAAAARHYFAKSPEFLTLPEAALLAALPKSPVQYDPRAYPSAALRRRNLVLQRMADQGYITAAQLRAAQTTPLRVARDDGYSVRAPYVVESVRQWMVERHGLTAVNTAGFTVVTTVDPALQAAANSALDAGLARVESLPGYRWPRYGTPAARPGAGHTPYLQGLVVAADPATGDLLAVVGGRDFRDSEFNRATQGMRQAGSAFKPFVYAAALSAGVAPTTLLKDVPLSLPRGDGTPWTPENSDGTFSGDVTMRTALVRSINVPTIRLALAVGLDSVIITARRAGLTTPIPAVASTAIGAADVRPLELIASYGAFANLGSWTPPRLVTLVQNADGIPVYEAAPPAPAPILDRRVAYQLTSMLSDAVDGGTGTAARRGVPAALPVAGKTGTSNENADVWFVGYTPDLVAGVWLGFDQRRTIMRGAFGGTLAAPIWADFARTVYRQRPIPAPWPVPEGLTAVRVRRSDGAPAPGDSSSSSVTEYFLEGTEPTARAITQRVLDRLRLWLRPR
jgi:penicillin-binding protein 1A